MTMALQRFCLPMYVHSFSSLNLDPMEKESFCPKLYGTPPDLGVALETFKPPYKPRTCGATLLDSVLKTMT